MSFPFPQRDYNPLVAFIRQQGGGHLTNPEMIPPRFLPTFPGQPAQMPGQYPAQQQPPQNLNYFTHDEVFAINRVMLGTEDEAAVNADLQLALRLGSVRDLGMGRGFLVMDQRVLRVMNVVRQRLRMSGAMSGQAQMGGQRQMAQYPGIQDRQVQMAQPQMQQQGSMAGLPGANAPGEYQQQYQNPAEGYGDATNGQQQMPRFNQAAGYNLEQGYVGGQYGQGGGYPGAYEGAGGEYPGT